MSIFATCKQKVMKNRIKDIIAYTGLNSASFADELGIQKSSISHIVNGRNNPSIDFIAKLTARYPEINSRWLITGDGEMLAGSTTLKRDISIDLFSSTTQQQNKSNTQLSKSEKLYTKPKVVDIVENKPFISGILPESSSQNQIEAKSIEKILIFYSDGTFKEFAPSN